MEQKEKVKDLLKKIDEMVKNSEGRIKRGTRAHVSLPPLDWDASPCVLLEMDEIAEAEEEERRRSE